MDDETAFQWLCRQLEETTPLDELETRGTVRLVLRHLGIDASTVGVEGLTMLLERVLPEELRLRGVEDSEALCQRLRDGLVARFARSESRSEGGPC